MRPLRPLLIVFGSVSTLLPSTSVAAQERSAAYDWTSVVLEATAREVERDGARPTIISRNMAISLTAMYDAWAAYDGVARGTRLGTELRRPMAERTLLNKKTAIAYAVYRTLVDLYPEDVTWSTLQMQAHGLDPADLSVNPATPHGIGNTAAAAVLSYRRHDGANQHGDEAGSIAGVYSDYTSYLPINSLESVNDPNHWQPISFDNGKGGVVTPGFLTPHWSKVKPFGLARADQFRPAPPPQFGSEQLKREVDEVMAYNANLTTEQKALVEFMRDGPRSTGQSGHWLKLAQEVSLRDHYGIDDDVKMFFAVANVAMDAFIAAWDAKRAYDSARPWTLVRAYYGNATIEGWGGPGLGVVRLPAKKWRPYSPSSFITPPFPGYVSGHSTVSAACAKVLELFTGSDRFGSIQHLKAGALTEPGMSCGAMQSRFDKKAPAAAVSCDVTLELPTFSKTAELAGISRIMGGYHIRADNEAGLTLGRNVAVYDWGKIREYFGNAPGLDATKTR